MFENLRRRIAQAIAPQPRRVAMTPAMFGRMYANASINRLSLDRMASTSSADTELSTSLAVLRNSSRALVRDNPYARRIRSIYTNNVIGSGVGLQARVQTTRGKLAASVNDAIEREFAYWSKSDSCHTGGILDFVDIERMIIDQLVEAGEVFIREHFSPFGNSDIPYALEVIESERLADEYTQTNPPPGGGLTRMGIEVDRYDRPMYYWIRERHPGELRSIPGATQRLERVPADQIIHIYIANRWPQARGVPAFHAVIQRLFDMNGYSNAEITAARAAACYMGFIKSNGSTPVDIDDPTTGERQRVFSPGMLEELAPGEEFQGYIPNRPNTAMDAFMRLMLREVCAGTDVSYESTSRDYSQSNYSSSRLALLDDRDLWKHLQSFYLRRFRHRVHCHWLQQAIFSKVLPQIPLTAYGVDPRKFEEVRFKPRGWTWIDPTREVESYKEAIRGGLTTLTDVIAQTAGGADVEDVLKTRHEELELIGELGLTFDTDPAKDAPKTAPDASAGKPEPKEPTEDDTSDGGSGSEAKVLTIKRGG